ncbi:multidrug resistance-associated protein 5 [Tanacetum coccineum]
MACYLFLMLGRKHPVLSLYHETFQAANHPGGLLALSIILCCVVEYLDYDPITSDVIAAGGFAELGCGGGGVKIPRASKEDRCPFHLWASWMQKEKSFQIKTLIEDHRCSRSFDFGTLINCNWIASTYGQCERAKQKALGGLEICLNEHYAKLWSYAKEILDTNPGSTVKLGVNPMPDGNNYFKIFYVCFKGLKDGWKRWKQQHWEWFMKLLIDDLELVDGHGLTIILDQHKGIVEAAKKVMRLAEHRQCARHIYANFRKKFTRVHFRNLFWKVSKATYPAKFKEVMNELKSVSPLAYQYLMDRNPDSWSRAFLSTDKAYIRSCMMERMQTMRETHAKWHDSVCPNIRKKFERIKDLHRFWHVIPSGEMKFEVKHGSEGYIVDEINRTCSCRHIYISDWLKTPAVKKAYNHYIYPLHGSDQWPETNYIPPLPPKARRMPGRNASESNGSSNRVGRHGRMMTCKNCYETGHNKRGCTNERRDPPPKEVRPKGKQKPWQDGMTNASRSVQRGGISTNRGGRSINRGGISTNRGGRSSNRCGLHIGMGVQVNPITGDAMLGSTRGVPLPAWPNGITPSNLRIQPQVTQVQVDDAPMINSQPTEPQPPVYQDDGVFDVEDSFGDVQVESQPLTNANGENAVVTEDISILSWGIYSRLCANHSRLMFCDARLFFHVACSLDGAKATGLVNLCKDKSQVKGQKFCDPDARLFFHVACSLDGAKATGLVNLCKDKSQVKGQNVPINALPTHKFKLKKNRNNDPRDNDSGVDEGGILAPGTENERAISGEDAVCCICLPKYADNDLLRELPCTHFFHMECVDKWLKINASCPLCKFEIGASNEAASSTEDSNQ